MHLDAPMVVRRRHTVTCWYRAAIVVLGLWWGWQAGVELIDLVWGLIQGNLQLSLEWLIRVVFIHVPRIAAMVVLVLVQRRVVRWIVPMPSTDPGCPKCGYSLKNLNSPICPECGTNLRG